MIPARAHKHTEQQLIVEYDKSRSNRILDMTLDAKKPELYPLRFKEILRNYSFGARNLSKIFKKTGLPEDHRLSETWEVCDRPNESSEIINGPLSGTTLNECIHTYKEKLLGTEIVEKTGLRFPLLIKFLDAASTLSEQAHHSDELAEAQGLEDPGKTEAWYMIHTDKDAVVQIGNKDGETMETVRKALWEERSKETMRDYTVSPGDAFLLYAGTMHYTEGGVIFYEIMQNSDVYIPLSFRTSEVSGEELDKLREISLDGVHVEDGFDCKTVPIIIDRDTHAYSYLMACEYFALDRVDFSNQYEFSTDGTKFYVFTALEEVVEVIARDISVKLAPGQTCLIPATIGTVSFKTKTKASLLQAYVPNLAKDIVKPLREHGFSDETISRLGGITKLNHLDRLLEK